MKMRIFLLSLLSLIIVGCVALEPPKRYADGNTFYSSKTPSIQIEVPQEYKYLGEVDGNYKAKHITNPSRTAGVKWVSYNYGHVDTNNYLSKLIQINIQQLKAGNSFSAYLVNTQTSLKHGIIELNNTNFQYAISLREDVGNFASQLLLDKGISSPGCILAISIGRRYGASNNSKMYLNYTEDISNFQDFGVESCEDWKDINLLNEQQINFLQNFENSIKSIIKVSDYVK